MNKFNILLIATLFLLPWSSCNSMPKDRSHVEFKTKSFKKGKTVYSQVRYYMTDGKTEYSTALTAFINNDSVDEIMIGGNKFNNNMEKDSLIHMNNESQLSMIDQVLKEIEQSYHLTTIRRFRICTYCLGNFSVRLADSCYRKHNDLRKIVMNDIFYKKLSLILGRHGLNVSFISLEDVYWNKLESIDPYCILSKNNKGKIYVDADIILYMDKTNY
jgi:hypothetical protein